MKIKQFLEKIILLVVSLVFVFAALEILFRIFFPHSGYSITYASWGWTHIPNTKVNYYTEIPEFHLDIRKRHYPISINYNSKGLRELEYGYQKNENTFRILMLGDSWAEDMGSFFDNLHTKWLEKKLNKLGFPYKIEVINGGHYAFDNANEYMFYLEEGRKYYPDIVMVMFTGDTASPDYASLDNGKLTLHFKEYSLSQLRYRQTVSWIRRNTHFGSFLLDKLTNLSKLKKLLINKGYKENDKFISGGEFSQEPVFTNAGFTDVDKAIWLSFKNKVENDSGKFVFINCIKSSLNDKKREFLNSIRILLLDNEATFKDSKIIKEADLKAGIYDRFYESYRSGYKMNERFADTIMDYLLKNKLLPNSL